MRNKLVSLPVFGFSSYHVQLQILLFLQVGAMKEDDLVNWGHHNFPSIIPDCILQTLAGNEVSFVFTNQVEGKLVPVKSAMRLEIKEVDEDKGPQHGRKAPALRATLPNKQPKMMPLTSGSIRSSFTLKPLPQPHSKLRKTSQEKG